MPIIDARLFDLAQPILKQNRETRRKRPVRFYLLSGMVYCSGCTHAYSAETSTDWQGQRVKKYRHRVSLGHCLNRSISEANLGKLVWNKIVSILLQPEVLRKGYIEAQERHEESTKRQRVHLETLKHRVINLEQQRQRLTTTYLDPELGLTKREYMEQKARIDDELKSISVEMGQVEKELSEIPTPAQFETLEGFACGVRERLENSIDPPSEEKRTILELLHVKVLIDPGGSISVNGWLGNQISEIGSLSTTSRYSLYRHTPSKAGPGCRTVVPVTPSQRAALPAPPRARSSALGSSNPARRSAPR